VKHVPYRTLDRVAPGAPEGVSPRTDIPVAFKFLPGSQMIVQAEGGLPLVPCGGGVADHRRSQRPEDDACVPATVAGAPASESMKAGSIHAAISISRSRLRPRVQGSVSWKGGVQCSRVSMESHILPLHTSTSSSRMNLRAATYTDSDLSPAMDIGDSPAP
jgi:hypothetical protein